MRQIHAAIEHLHRGDFECAITLAAAGEGMLPPTEEPYFRELAAKWRYEDIVNWLRQGEIKDIENGKKEQREAVTITELGTIAVIYRAIAKFDAVFGDEKTSQMISFRICAGPRLAGRLTPRVGPVEPVRRLPPEAWRCVTATARTAHQQRLRN